MMNLRPCRWAPVHDRGADPASRRGRGDFAAVSRNHDRSTAKEKIVQTGIPRKTQRRLISPTSNKVGSAGIRHK